MLYLLCNLLGIMWKELTEEERDLLMTDLSGRIKYDTVLDVKDEGEIYLAGVNWWNEVEVKNYSTTLYPIDDVRPYLRRVCDLSEKEKKEYERFHWSRHHEWDGHSTYTDYVESNDVFEYLNWCNAHYLDKLGLIDKGLARVAKEGMYKTV